MRISKKLIEYRKFEIRKWKEIDRIVNKTSILIYVLLATLVIMIVVLRG